MSSFEATAYGSFMRIGVVGCGRVGTAICRAIDAGIVHADLAAVCDLEAARVQRLVFGLKRPTRSMSLAGLVASVAMVIEATNRHAAPQVMMAAINGGRDLLVTNPAAVFARDDFPRLAHERGLTIFAVNSLLAGASLFSTPGSSSGTLLSLTLTCPPAVLADAPFLRGRDLKAGSEPLLVFQGEAVDAMAAIPAVANLVASAMLGAGDAELLVRVRADPSSSATDIELLANADQQQTAIRSCVPADGSDPVHPEIVGAAAAGVLRSLMSPLRLA